MREKENRKSEKWKKKNRKPAGASGRGWGADQGRKSMSMEPVVVRRDTESVIES